MTEIILGLIIFSLIGFIGWREKHFSQERKDLVAGILAKDIEEYKFAVTPPVKEKKEQPQEPPEFVATSALSDEEFFEAIRKGNEVN